MEAAERLKDELVAEMTRAQIIRTGINLRFGNVVLEKRAPISGLTEDVFIRQIDELDPVMLVFRNDVLMALRRNKLIPQELANFYGPFGRSCFHKLSKVHT